MATMASRVVCRYSSCCRFLYTLKFFNREGGGVMPSLGIRSASTRPAVVNDNSNKVDRKATSQVPHVPVMADQVLEMLNLQPGQTILDLTFGAGGHTRRILDSSDDVQVLGLDRDPVAYSYGKELEKNYEERFKPLLGRFSEVPRIMEENGVSDVDGILMDLGCSSMQFDTASRGFAISQDGPLDMRMDGDRFPDQPTAADVLAHIEEEPLARILKCYGEEKQAKKIARAIVQARYMFQSLRTTSELAYLVESVLDEENRLDKLARPTHVATKTFQAIRIFVNNEINELNRAMEISHDILKTGGRLVALTFHSLEDRVVKRHLVGIDMDEPISKSMSQKYRNALNWHSANEVDKIFDKKWTSVNKHVVVPTFAEIEENPRSRSAKLRCAIKNEANK